MKGVELRSASCLAALAPLVVGLTAAPAAWAVQIGPFPPAGLFQPFGAGGCAATDNGSKTLFSSTCGDDSQGNELGANTLGIHPDAIAVSPDGQNLYVGGHGVDSHGLKIGYGLVGLSRDQKTGALATLGGTGACLASRNTGLTTCDDAIEPSPTDPGVIDVAVSPDGRNVYVTAEEVLYVFARNTSTGALSATPAPGAGPDCLTGNQQFYSGCTQIQDGWQPVRMAFSPDGHFLYVISADFFAGSGNKPPEIWVLQRNATTGALAPIGGSAACVADVSAPGTTCSTAIGLTTCADHEDLLVSPDGNNLYFASDAFDVGNSPVTGCDPGSSGGLVAFQRDTSSGALTQLSGAAGCVRTGVASHQPAYPTASCGTARAVAGANAIAIDPTGRSLYVSAWPSLGSSTVSVLTRDPLTGALSDLSGAGGCLVDATLPNPLGCGQASGLWPSSGITVSPDGGRVYTTGFCSTIDPNLNSTCSFFGSGALTVLVRNGVTGEISQPDTGGPWVPRLRYSVGGSGPYSSALWLGQFGLAASTGGSVYVVDPWNDRVDTLAPAPTCADVAVGTKPSTPVNVPLECTDNGTGIPFSIGRDNGTLPQRGKVSGWPKQGIPSLSATVTYTPYNGSDHGPFETFPFGTDTFGYVAQEIVGFEASTPAVVTVSIPKIQIVEGPLLLFKKDLLRVRGGEAWVTLTCPRSARGGAIVTLTLTAPAQALTASPVGTLRIGSRRLRVRAGRTVTVGIPLRRSTRRYLAMHDSLAAQLIATARNGIGKSRTRTIRQAVTLQG